MAFAFPDSFRFADSHEYANADGELVRVGISAFAVDQLGDIVFVDLPDVGASLAKGISVGAVEAVKAGEDMYAPIAGEVVQRNEAVLASPEELQNDPHGEGWLLVLRPSDPSELDSLMTAEAYGAKVNAGCHPRWLSSAPGLRSYDRPAGCAFDVDFSFSAAAHRPE